MKDKILTVEKYLDKIKPYLSDMINNHKTQRKWRVHSGNKAIEHKTQLTIAINFISSKLDSDETRTMRTKSNNVEIMMSNETDEVIKELFISLRKRYKKNRRINERK